VPRARSHTCCLSICRDGGSGRALDSPQGSPIEAQEVFSVDSNETTQQEVRTLRKFCLLKPDTVVAVKLDQVDEKNEQHFR
jgi:hypothetical protein